MPTVSQVLVQTLVHNGIDVVFGLPGGENSEFMGELSAADIRFVLVRNESSSIFMADVRARLTGKVGVALTTLGPGIANACAGIAHAWLDRAPVLLITAQTQRRLLGCHTHQVIDTQAIMRPVTKHSEELTTENVVERVEHAFQLAMDGRPGIVHLGLSGETAGSECGGWHPKSTYTALETTQNPISEFQIPKSSRPIIIAGLGLEPERPYAALHRLAEAWNAPVIVTPKAKGAIADDHPLAAGVIGLTRVDPAYEILDEADLIFVVGFDVVELVKPWKQAAPLIWIAPWENADPKIDSIAELVGPMEPILNRMTEMAEPSAANWGSKRISDFRLKRSACSLPMAQSGRMLPQDVLKVLRRETPRDILVSSDVGSHKIFFGLEWKCFTPNRYMLSNGLSSMSFGLPAAAAAALTLGEPTLCVTGDAGLAMVMGELGMIAENGLPVITVVMNDSALDLIRSHQRRAGKKPYGVEFHNPDWRKIAGAFGIDGYRACNESEMQCAIRNALVTRKPALIEAFIDPISYPTTLR
jgi:acetolactate synthase I/II/III large subunit